MSDADPSPEQVLDAIFSAFERAGEMDGLDSDAACRIAKAAAVAIAVPGAEFVRIPSRYRMPAEVVSLFRDAARYTDLALDAAQTLWIAHGIPEAHLAGEALQVAAAALRPTDRNAPLPPAWKHPGLGRFRPTTPQLTVPYQPVHEPEPPPPPGARPRPEGAAEPAPPQKPRRRR